MWQTALEKHYLFPRPMTTPLSGEPSEKIPIQKRIKGLCAISTTSCFYWRLETSRHTFPKF